MDTVLYNGRYTSRVCATLVKMMDIKKKYGLALVLNYKRNIRDGKLYIMDI